jgi:hypothetical protein
VQESILKKFPDADISVSMVWIEMLPTDNRGASENMAASIRDPRVVHYFDPRGARLAGDAFANGIIREGTGPAWDVYFFYDKDAEWQDGPPKPVEWWHQLSGGQRADPARFAGGIVGEKLHDAIHKLTETACMHGTNAK